MLIVIVEFVFFVENKITWEAVVFLLILLNIYKLSIDVVNEGSLIMKDYLHFCIMKYQEQCLISSVVKLSIVFDVILFLINFLYGVFYIDF